MSRKYRYTIRIHIHDFDYYIEPLDQQTLTEVITHCVMLHYSDTDCFPFTDHERVYFSAVEAFCESAFISDEDAAFLKNIMQEYLIPPIESVIYADNILYLFIVM